MRGTGQSRIARLVTRPNPYKETWRAENSLFFHQRVDMAPVEAVREFYRSSTVYDDGDPYHFIPRLFGSLFAFSLS